MTVDDTGCAGGASVADFYIVPVEILCSLCPGGKCLSNSCRKFLAILVFTFIL